jgi:hypothetical protein
MISRRPVPMAAYVRARLKLPRTLLVVARAVARQTFSFAPSLTFCSKWLILLVGGDGFEPPTLSV